MTWFWSVSNTRTNKGFVTYNKLETTKDKKLRLTGVFYLLKRENSDASNWKIEWRKEVTKDDKKELDAKNFNTYFPKPYW